MGKVTGFMEYRREALRRAPIEVRIRSHKEFEKPFEDENAVTQAARCMDCGVPFCQGETGCPVDNLMPEWNDLVYRGRWEEALDNLHSTNNFPDFTGRLCPAPCESACTLNLTTKPVAIKALERTIIGKGFEEGWVEPLPPESLSGHKVAVIGSGPAGLACGQQLQRAGHSVTLFEKSDRLGGLLRYGIPDFKMEKWVIDRRIRQMKIEGVEFKTGCNVGVDIPVRELLEQYDAVVLAGGCEKPRDLPVPGRQLKNIHFAMEFLVGQNRINAGDRISDPINVKGKRVIVIGGGDTGSDCVGTAIRQQAASVKQLEIFPRPPRKRAPNNPWPFYANILRTSTSQEEAEVERLWSISTTEFLGDDMGNLKSLAVQEVRLENGAFQAVKGSETEIPADTVFLAMGFERPEPTGLVAELRSLGLNLDGRGNVEAPFGEEEGCFATSVDRVYACGDMRRGQSLIVWAIAEGRKCALEVHRHLSQKERS